MGIVRPFCTALFLIGLMSAGATARVSTTAPANPYTLTVQALVGPTGTDVTVRVTAAPGSAVPTALKGLALVAPNWAKLLTNVPLTGGQWTGRYTDLPRGKALKAAAEIRTTRIWILFANTVVLYRPDLGFASVGAPTTAHPNDVISVPIVITETRGDLGASFDLVVSGDGIQGLTATNIRVNPLGSTQLLLDIKVLSPGTQTVTLSIVNQIPGDYDPTNNTATFVLQVTSSIASTQYYGGYTRTDGSDYQKFEDPSGGVTEVTTTGKTEIFSFNCSSNQAMSWPMSVSAKMYADGVEVYSVDRSGLMPTQTQPDGSATYFESFGPDFYSYIWITSSAPGSTPASQFVTSRSASDYTQVINQLGTTFTSIQQYGVFLNATVSSQMKGTVTSALGQIGGDTGVQPILYSRQDIDQTDPFILNRHQDFWTSYSSGDLH